MKKVLEKLFGGAAANMADSIGDLVDRFVRTKEEKDAFNKERAAIFDGHIRKPSEILALTKPEHASHEIKEFKGKKPSLLKKSYALKNADKFKKQKKREL